MVNCLFAVRRVFRVVWTLGMWTTKMPHPRCCTCLAGKRLRAGRKSIGIFGETEKIRPGCSRLLGQRLSREPQPLLQFYDFRES